jgi:hypothetical protein
MIIEKKQFVSMPFAQQALLNVLIDFCSIF